MEVLFGSCRVLFLLDVCLERYFGSKTFGMDWCVVHKWGLSHSGTCKINLSGEIPATELRCLGDR